MRASSILSASALAGLSATTSVSHFTRTISSEGIDTTVIGPTTFTTTVSDTIWTVYATKPNSAVTLFPGESNTYTGSFYTTEDTTILIPESELATYTGKIDETIYSFAFPSFSQAASSTSNSSLATSTPAQSSSVAHSIGSPLAASSAKSTAGSSSAKSTAVSSSATASSSSATASSSSGSSSSDSGAGVSNQVTLSVAFGSILSLIYLL